MNPAPQHVDDRLLEYAYGELSGLEAKSVQGHLESCARCSDALDQMKRVRQTMAQLPSVPAPAKGLDSLLAYAEQAAKRARAEPRRSPSWLRWTVPITSVAALAVVLAVSTKVLKTGTLDQPPAETSAITTPAPRVESEVPADARKSEPKMALAKKPQADSESSSLEQRSSAPASPAGREESAAGASQHRVAPSALQNRAGNDGRTFAQPPESKSEQKAKKMAAKPQRVALADQPTGGTHGREGSNGIQKNEPGVEGGIAGGVVGGVLGGSVKTDAEKDRDQREGVGEVSRQTANLDAAPENQGAAKELASNGIERVVGATPGRAASLRSKAAPAGTGAPASPPVVSRAAEARKAGDRETEAALLQEALARGARGQERARMLRQLCDALDALRRPAEADSACDAVIREFPDTDEAKTALERRTRRANPQP